MKSLYKYVVESLSADNEKLLQRYISLGLITDEDIEGLKNVIRTRKGQTDDVLKQFLDSKGLSDKYLKGNSDFVDRFTKLFAKNHRILDTIKNNEGTCTWDEFKKGSNIFKDFCRGWENEAKYIAEMTDVVSHGFNANVGPYEILMKFIIKEACSMSSGDVCIDLNGNKLAVEVKKGGKSGARVNGQGTESIENMYDYLNEYLIDICPNAKYKDYFNSQTAAKHIEDVLLSATPQDQALIDIFIESLCKAVFKQYQLSPDSPECRAVIESALRVNSKQHYVESGKIDKKGIFSLLGAIQLCAYSIEDDFNYIVIFEGTTGKYVCFDSSNLSDLEYVLGLIYFSTDAGGGRAKTPRPCVK